MSEDGIILIVKWVCVAFVLSAMFIGAGIGSSC